MRKFPDVFCFSALLSCSAMLSAHAQADVAASVYGTFNPSTSGNATTQNQSDAAGALFELRHIRNPLVGFEATYSYNRANEAYTSTMYGPCGVQTPPQCITSVTTAPIHATAHEITGDWVASLKYGNLRPFALVGAGVLVNLPTAGMVAAEQCDELHALCQVFPVSTRRNTTGVYVYGAGLDWTLFPNLGLRLQYRGNVYKAPYLTTAFTSINSFTHNSEPMLGAFFRF